MEDEHLIAEFMELAHQSKSNQKDNKEHWLYESPETGEYTYPEDLEYSESWNWLIPVEEKINESMIKEGKTYGVMYSTGKGLHVMHRGEVISSNIKDKNNSLLDAHYKTVTEFIKWYNEQK